MAQKDIGNKVPIYKLKKTEEVMKYYDEWGKGNKYDKDMVDWNYTGPKETSEVFIKHQKNKNIKIYDAGCGTGLVGVELKKYGFSNFYGADLSQKLLDLVPKNLYQKLDKIDLNKNRWKSINATSKRRSIKNCQIGADSFRGKRAFNIR